MLLDYRQFSNNQLLTNLNSTGEVSTETHDLEEVHSSSLTDQQVTGGILVTIMDDTSFTGGTEGLLIEVRTAPAEALSSGYHIVGARSVPAADVVAGKQIWIPIFCDVAEKELGLWYKAINTTFTGSIYVDADYQPEMVNANEDLQKRRT
jgi:hypothetical protein